jgi:hypothetical protein
MKTYIDAKVSMHHRLPGLSFQNVASPTISNTALILQHNKHGPLHHDDMVLLNASFGCAAPSQLQ